MVQHKNNYTQNPNKLNTSSDSRGFDYLCLSAMSMFISQLIRAVNHLLERRKISYNSYQRMLQWQLLNTVHFLLWAARLHPVSSITACHSFGLAAFTPSLSSSHYHLENPVLNTIPFTRLTIHAINWRRIFFSNKHNKKHNNANEKDPKHLLQSTPVSNSSSNQRTCKPP